MTEDIAMRIMLGPGMLDSDALLEHQMLSYLWSKVERMDRRATAVKDIAFKEATSEILAEFGYNPPADEKNIVVEFYFNAVEKTPDEKLDYTDLKQEVHDRFFGALKSRKE